MKLSLRNLLGRLNGRVIALPLAALAAMAAMLVVVVNETGYHESSAAVTDLAARGVARVDLFSLLQALTDAESAQRGYLLTGRKSYLDPYEKAMQSIDNALQKLHAAHDDIPDARTRLVAIEEKARRRQSELTTALQLHASGRDAQWREILGSDIGKESMDEMRVLVGEFLNDQSRGILDQRAALRESLRLSRIGVNAMAAVTLLACVLFVYETRRRQHAVTEHARALQAESDRLEREVLRRTTELTHLARHLQSAREDERSRLARELHDELGALLTAAKLDAARLMRNVGKSPSDFVARMDSLNNAIDQGILLKRRIIEGLRPSSLSNLGLVAALEILAREFEERAEIRVHTLLDDVSLSPDAQIIVFRVVQEALTNTAKYAQASEVTITLSSRAGRVDVGIEDDGIGFDTTQARPSAHGLTGMRYRVESEQGGMQVTSTPGRGTQIAVWLPQSGAQRAPDH